MECHEFTFVSPSGARSALLMHSHGSCHILVRRGRFVTFACCPSFHPHAIHVRLDTYATLTGIDFARDRLGEISILHGSEADAG